MIESFLEKAASYVLAPYQSLDAFLFAITGAVRAIADLQSKTGWLFLLTSVLIGAIVYAYEKRKGSARSVSLAGFLFPREVYLHRSAIVDYKFVAIDLTIKLLVYTPLVSGFSWLVYKAAAAPFAGLSATLPFQDWLGGTIVVPILAVAAADFGFFLSHYLMHKIPVLWYFHEVHHSAEVLTPVTVYRTHPVEDLINAVVGALIAGLGAALYTSSTGAGVDLPTLFEVNVIQFAFFTFAFQLRHSHVWLSYGPVLSWIFISPAQHQIHHSTDPRHWDKNFGFMFAIWDAMFRSLYIPRSRETFRIGAPNADPQDFSSVTRLYFLPFAKAARRVQRGMRQRFGGEAS